MRHFIGFAVSLSATLILSLPVTAFAQQLGDRLNEAEIAEWTEQLHSRDELIRGTAIEALSSMGGAAISVAPELVELLGDQRNVAANGAMAAMQYHARNLLVKLGPPVVDLVLPALHHDSRQVRMGAIETLGELHEPRAVAPLLELFKDKDRGVASQAVNALQKIAEPAIEPLIDRLTSEDEQVRSSALSALSGIRDPAVARPIARLMYGENQDLRRWAAYSLKELAREIQQRSDFGMVRENNAAERARQAQVEKDERVRAAALGEIAEALRSSDNRVRLEAAEAAYFVNAAELVDALFICAQSERADVRMKAVKALAVTRHPQSLPLLVKKLADSDAEIREAAADGIHFCARTTNGDDSFLVQPLLAALDDKDARVRRSIISALGETGPDKERVIINRLRKVLQGDEPEVINEVMNTVTELGGKAAADDICRWLEDPKTRDRAAVALASFDDRRALPVLRQRLESKEYAIIAAIGRMQDRESVPRLIAMLSDEGNSRQAAIDALGKIGDSRALEPLCEQLKRNQSTLASIAYALRDLGDPRAVRPLVDAIKTPRFNRFGGFPDQEFGFFSGPLDSALQSFGAAAIKPLGESLKDESPLARRAAAWALYNMSFPDRLDKEDFVPVVEPLATALNDPSKEVRYSAALALGRLGDQRAVGVLLEMVAAAGAPPEAGQLGINRNWYIFQNSSSYLGQLKDPNSVEPLIGLLRNPAAGTRAIAARALGGIRDERAINPLLQALSDDNAEVRTAVATSLGNFKVAAAVDSLVQSLKDPDQKTRIVAAQSLGRIGDARAVEPLSELAREDDFELQVAAAIALLRLNDERGVALITTAMKDADRNRRESAVVAVSSASFRDDRLIEPLIESLSDPFNRVRIYAAGSLGRIGGSRATESLLDKLSDRENLQSVLQALSRTNDQRALAALVRHLDDEDPHNRSAAAVGIGALGRPEGVLPLVAHASDKSLDVRISILRSLGTIGGDDAIPPIVAALDDEHFKVREQAERSLRKLEARQFSDSKAAAK